VAVPRPQHVREFRIGIAHDEPVEERALDRVIGPALGEPEARVVGIDQTAVDPDPIDAAVTVGDEETVAIGRRLRRNVELAVGERHPRRSDGDRVIGNRRARPIRQRTAIEDRLCIAAVVDTNGAAVGSLVGERHVRQAGWTVLRQPNQFGILPDLVRHVQSVDPLVPAVIEPEASPRNPGVFGHRDPAVPCRIVRSEPDVRGGTVVRVAVGENVSTGIVREVEPVRDVPRRLAALPVVRPLL